MQQTVDIYIPQGANFRMVVDYRNPDGTGASLAGYTWTFLVKDRPGGATLMNGSAHVSNDPTVVGRVNINVPANVTAPLNFERGVYDILGTKTATDKIRIIRGIAFLVPGVS